MANRRFIDFPIASTVGDNDIVLIWQDGANKQTTKATILSGLPENLEDLNDVVISGLTNGQILRYDSVTGKWENTDQGNLDLNDLNDVSIVSPSNGQVLVYNSSTSKWENSSGGFVPYVGAVTTVDLGAQGLRAGYVRFDTSVASVPDEQGLMYWDASRSTAALIMNGTLQHIGQDTFFYVKNSSGSNIPKGTCVRFAGTDGASGHLLIAPFLANGSVPSSYFMGVTAEAIANGSFGQVMHFGELEGINTSGFTAGALLYASTTVAGGFQTTVPVAPNNIVLVAAAVNSKNNGAIIVRPQIGSNINNDEGVKITSPTTGDLLQLQAGGLWENKTLAQVIGSAYVPSTRTITINGTTQDLSANRTYNVGTVTSVGLSSATSGVTIGSTPVTTSGTITLAIATASGSQQGLLSSTDWTTFNNKQNALTNPVTGTGTINTVPKFTGTTSIGDSSISDNNTEVNISKRTFISSGVHQFVFTPNLSSTSNRIETLGGLPLEITTNGSSIGLNVGGGSSQFSMTNTSAAFTIPVTSNGQAATSPAFIANNSTGGSGTAQHYINFTAGTTTIARMLRGNGASGLVANGLNIDNFDGFGVRLNQLGGSGGTFSVTGGAATFSSSVTVQSGNSLFVNNAANTRSGFLRTSGDGTELSSFAGAGEPLILIAPDTNATIRFYTGGATGANERMRITSGGNLLVGTTTDDGNRLQVNGGINMNGSMTIQSSGVTRGFFGDVDGDNNVQLRSQSALTFKAGGNTERMRITSGGNVGIGVTPSAWMGGSTALQVIRGGLWHDGSGYISLFNNAYYDGSNWRYIASTWGTNFAQVNGNFQWFQAPSGTAGNAISFTQAMTLTSGSNLLVGTTTDNGARLQVSGTATFSSSVTAGTFSATDATGSAILTTNGGGEGVLSVNTANPLRFFTNGSEKMRITSSGNVGIGTSSPQAYTNFTTLSVDNPTNGGVVSVRYNGTAYLNLYTAFGEGRVEGANGSFLTFRTTDTERMRITSGGNVLIGTTTSNGARLQVSGTNPAFDIQNSGSTFFRAELDGSNFTYLSTLGANDMILRTNSTERMRITSGGFTKASNNGAYLSATGSYHEFNSNVGNTSALVIRNTHSSSPAGPDIYFTASPNNTNQAFLYCADGTEGKFVVWSNGDVDSRTNSYSGWSDIKLKENITNATPKLQDLLKVKIKNYNFIGDSKKQLGVIAQELEEIFPALVYETPNFKYDKETGQKIDTGQTTKSVKYSVFVPMLIKAIQELKQEIDTLKN